MNARSLQDRYAPNNKCFGCGPSNPEGLQIKSRAEGDAIVLDWTPATMHEAFPGVVNGGIVGTLFDCHGNWTAAWHLMQSQKLDTPPGTVTSEFHVKLKRPTSSKAPVRIVARVVESEGDRVVVEEELHSGGRVTATCRGVFVAVHEGHPAFHRWD